MRDGPTPASKPAMRDRDGLHKRRGIWHFKLKVAGRWREFSTGERSYREARRKRQEAIQAQEEGRLPSGVARAKLSAIAPAWLDERKKLVAHQTWLIDKGRMKPLLRLLGHKRLCEISNDDVRAFQVKRSAEVSARTANLEIKVLRQILKAHRLWARIGDDYRPLPENKEGPGRALTPEEEKVLFETAARRPGWQVAYYAALIASNTTTRACEIRGLRLQDVDLMKRQIRIRRRSTKNNSGVRVIPLNDAAFWAVAKAYERATNLGACAPEHYLFPACPSRKIDVTKHQQSWRTAWRNLRNEAALGKLRFHDLRVHSITRMAEAGVPEQTLMAIAGHVSRQMLEHYSRIRQQAKQDAVKAIDSFKPQERDSAEEQHVN